MSDGSGEFPFIFQGIDLVLVVLFWIAAWKAVDLAVEISGFEERYPKSMVFIVYVVIVVLLLVFLYMRSSLARPDCIIIRRLTVSNG